MQAKSDFDLKLTAINELGADLRGEHGYYSSGEADDATFYARMESWAVYAIAKVDDLLGRPESAGLRRVHSVPRPVVLDTKALFDLGNQFFEALDQMEVNLRRLHNEVDVPGR